MSPETKKSFVRVKVWPAILISNFGFVYAFYSYVAAGSKLSEMTLAQVGVFAFAMTAAWYGNNINCERCKSKWNKTGYETSQDAKTPWAYWYRRLGEMNFAIKKKCQICGLERY